ncbi:hypothetical protein F7734_01945 [Scytonema sp. UIC 10036]|uniref:hypothetical protein n=1 Tax=Scytonema sp. UIC 10036 TaxID=2304196 RepID=UPI0012DA0FCE|nr:hypothetical protein [Scytonema sp. UIC 10036]MUG91312.1 hypothetical protein [Scytonema sp. UIC 10036]
MVGAQGIAPLRLWSIYLNGNKEPIFNPLAGLVVLELNAKLALSPLSTVLLWVFCSQAAVKKPVIKVAIVRAKTARLAPNKIDNSSVMTDLHKSAVTTPMYLRSTSGKDVAS